jgi:hypothetical protein
MNWLRSHTGLLATETDVSGASLSTIQSLTDLSGSRVAADLSGALLSTVSTTHDLSGASVDLVDGRANLIKDVSALLSPLTADESAAVAAAKKTDVDPAPANDTEVPYMLVSDLSNNEIEIPNIDLQWAKFRTQNYGSIPVDEAWNVSAANSGEMQDGFATFQSTWVDQVVSSHTPKVQEKTDSYGRRFFLFDNGVYNSFTAIVFEVQGRQMLSLGGTILPLDEFFSLVSCEFKGESRMKLCGELRPGNEVGKVPEHVECVFPNRSLRISKMTAEMVMAVLTHLSHVYNGSPHTVKNTVIFEESQPQQPWYYGSLGITFLSGLVYGAALVAGKFVK